MNNPKENFIKSEGSNQFNESIKSVLNDIKNLKGKQEYLGNQLCAVKQENEILWRELSLLRQKHAAQNSILNKVCKCYDKILLLNITFNITYLWRSLIF